MKKYAQIAITITACVLVLLGAIFVSMWNTKYTEVYVQEALDTTICSCEYSTLVFKSSGQFITPSSVTIDGKTAVFDGGGDYVTTTEEDCIHNRAANAAWSQFIPVIITVIALFIAVIAASLAQGISWLVSRVRTK